MPIDVGGALAAYGERTRVALCDHLRAREPRRHLYDPAAEYVWRGGRMLRPTLCIAAARCFGASIDDAIGAAVGIELLHNAFLIHDDVEDESDERRGQPTLHVRHGVPLAVNAGDGLLLLGLQALLATRVRLGPSLTLAILDDACRMARETVEGQALDLGWRSDNALGITDDDYLRMVLKKTCWYTTIFPLRTGMTIGTREPSQLDGLLPFGFFLGAAFQIQDDLLNLQGDRRRYGKEIDGDLWEGKRTLMLVRLLQQVDDAERLRLKAFLDTPRQARRARDVAWVRERMEAYGCLAHARAVAHALAGAAQHEFEREFRSVPDGPDKELLAAMPAWVLSRA
ncbi:MAG TPA: polyprenyl synthetase family protein [Candidatus Limnocylindria bacterium]|nr:polyprenyl synthetase family protein [Candidatus Limnocylindria bacterium]